MQPGKCDEEQEEVTESQPPNDINAFPLPEFQQTEWDTLPWQQVPVHGTGTQKSTSPYWQEYGFHCLETLPGDAYDVIQDDTGGITIASKKSTQKGKKRKAESTDEEQETHTATKTDTTQKKKKKKRKLEKQADEARKQDNDVSEEAISKVEAGWSHVPLHSQLLKNLARVSSTRSEGLGLKKVVCSLSLCCVLCC